MFKNLYYLTLLLASTILIPSPSLSENPERVILGTNTALGVLPLIAQKEGYFQEQNLVVELKELNVAKIVADSLISGDIEFGTIVDANLAFFGFHPTDLKIVATLGSRLADGIYFKESSGITQPKDLVGKRVGYIPGTVSQIFLYKLLESVGLKWSDVKTIIIQPQSANAAIRNNSLDAVAVWPPFSFQLEQEFKTELKSFMNSQDIYPSRMYLASTEKTLKSRPGISERLLTALKKAEKTYKENPALVAPYISKRIGSEATEVSRVLKGYVYNIEKETQSSSIILDIGTWINKNIEGYKDLTLPDYKVLFSEIGSEVEKDNNVKQEVQKEAAKLKPVTFCRPNNMISALFYIAEKKNFFKEEGIDPKFETATNGKICQDMLLARKADFMIAAEAPFTYIAASKPPIHILAVVQKNPETAIFTRADKGIKNFNDLKGKRIAYLPGSASNFFLSKILRKNNILKSDIKLTAIQPPAMPQALVSGAIDAFSMWEPWGSMSRSGLGENLIVLEDSSTYQQFALLTAHKEALTIDRTIPISVLRSVTRASNFIKTNNQESFNILKEAIKFEESAFKRLWDKYDHSISLSKEVISLMEENFNILKTDDENFKDSEMPKFKDYIDSSYLKSIDPSLVKDAL